MRDILFKIAVILALISIAPLIVVISRRENPPKYPKVEVHNKQIVRDFTLKSNGWVLKAPIAEVKKECISLKLAKLKVLSNKTVTIMASEACYKKQSNVCNMKNVKLLEDNLTAITPYGIYNGRKNTFRTLKSCLIKFSGNNTIEGNGCIANLKDQRFIILNGVKSTLRSMR